MPLGSCLPLSAQSSWAAASASTRSACPPLDSMLSALAPARHGLTDLDAQVLCIAENAIGPLAFRNDDILRCYSGK